MSLASPSLIARQSSAPGTRNLEPPAFLTAAIEAALARIDSVLPAFTDAWPEPSSIGGMYRPMDNTEWTNGFWTGMLWLAYELTGAERYRAVAERHVDSFHDRVFQRININHHDLGFLYSLSCVAAYRLTGSQKARGAALEAADRLLDRYLPQAGIIQAWGDLTDPDEAGRMIIDCNLNLPLLYWAAAETRDARFSDAATNHIRKAQTFIVRPDNSTFHTFHMDPVTGEPKFGSTHQGASDHSCWARGQAWGISGFPLNYRYLNDPTLIATSADLADYFLARLPDDQVCCWDLIYTSEGVQRDSSAAAIAACGLLELAAFMPETEGAKYHNAAVRIVESLARDYASKAGDPGNGLLKHGVYHMPKRIGVDEYCIWGDYFYLEALVRLHQNWVPYW
ncbi:MULTISPECIES: glycoside hydrolase family 88 protein [Asticcacaulis]|uniref:glycoside hydrolase family 88 protein n=1 Tax=Asticcacaulis TaxID=76890 RepID=UPI001AE58E7E|nr:MULTISPECIES: glycoside hydrolase family 88 protein [Asticcacaulis]MBP2157898.1 unsaturated chondroitin disaccharide hydrolase [Asticcacaulis solisilvae]MDR6798943.1 unsaturated chondroitin disaccharide hydrolase [Asticcacaulis sp. BE141]